MNKQNIDYKLKYVIWEKSAEQNSDKHIVSEKMN